MTTPNKTPSSAVPSQTPASTTGMDSTSPMPAADEPTQAPEPEPTAGALGKPTPETSSGAVAAPQSAEASVETPSPATTGGRAGKTKPLRDNRRGLSSQQRDEIVRLHKLGLGTRRIALKVGVGRKAVRSLLHKHGYLQRPAPAGASSAAVRASKLDPFRDLIQEKVQKKLTNARILRELREQGYQGGLSILAEYTRTLRVQPQPTKKVWRRFETAPGEETQFDWSPYRVPIGGKLRVVHAFGATLGFSRKIHVRFYPDEREATLLEAHVHAFEDFGGVTRRGVYDRMSTVVLGTIGKQRKPLWHPRLRDFARYYGYEPYLCKVADPDRKGKDERVFLYLERDFIRGAEFDSLEDLNAKVRLWLDEVANCRVHGTTRKVPDEAFEQERPFLIALPDSRYPAYD